MIAHLVLFRPKPTLNADQRAQLITALEYALTNIPLIKRAHVGRRVKLGRAYDEANAQDFPYAAILEFETENDLRSYLNHPAHEALGQQFYTTSAAALVFDYELMIGDDARNLLGHP